MVSTLLTTVRQAESCDEWHPPEVMRTSFIDDPQGEGTAIKRPAESAVSYEIKFTRIADEHLGGFRRSDRNVILDDIRAQLQHQPTVETRKRKLLRKTTMSDWELRIGPFRVFYDVDEHDNVVRVVAVGRKEHERLFIGGKEFKL